MVCTNCGALIPVADLACPVCGRQRTTQEVLAEPPPPDPSKTSGFVADKYRTFGPRFWAGFIDGLVFLPISLSDSYLSAPARGPLILISWAIVSYSAYWLYTVSLHARFGQTLGKRAMHVKVMDVSEQRIPSLGQAFLRDVGYIILNVSSLVYFVYIVVAHKYVTGTEQVNSLPGRILEFAGLGWFLLEVITMFANSKRRAVHDLIAKTVVMNVA
jgi:uncharacterized RDD family membrane protein YckC